jgi:inner membrane protein
VSKTQARDIQRFEHFSADYLVDHPGESNVIGDLRYAFLPNAVSPIWGILWSDPPVDEHTPFLQFRGLPEEGLERYWSMLWGESVVGASRLR